jgi:hypothetical protein
MEIITLGKKEKYLNALERYHIYKASRDNLSMDDTHIDTYNPIFETLYRIYTKQQNTEYPCPSPMRHGINAEASTLHTHNIHTHCEG